MQLVIDHTARFFTVVGAPYIPEHHLNTRPADIATGASDRRLHPGAAPSETCSTGWWPHDEE